MSKRNKLILLVILLVAALTLTGLSFWVVTKNHKETATTEKKLTTKITIAGFEDPSLDNFQVKEGTTALEILNTINQQNPLLELKTKEYKDLGTMVTGMAGKQNGTGQKYWQYYVNGKMPMVGADQYKVKDQDQIKWAFAKSQF